MTNFPTQKLAVVAVLLLAVSCRSTGSGTAEPPVDFVPPVSSEDHHESLNATLWVQTAAEYRATAIQAYRTATVMLDHALEDSEWNACPGSPGMADRPPAVILDVDETVLDNSPYEAWLIESGEEYDRASWNEWVRMEAAGEVPGALAFTRRADSLGVAVFYVTNRRAEVEEPTRANLERLGFPFADSVDVLLTRGESPESEDRDKQSRRDLVSSRYRCVMLVGDDLGDFVSGARGTLTDRMERFEMYADFWGTRWIVLPNPQYGSWKEALFGGDYSVPASERRERRRHALRLPGGEFTVPVR
jgi:acid phosphatase